MNARRTNKSHKVPNVKLRPPQPSSSASSKRSNDRSYKPSNSLRNLIRHTSPDSEPENTFVDSCPRPFKGVVLCATGIEDKTTLFKIALELGAEHRKDLTLDTTHLIADEHGGAKYNCALQMKVPILRSAWVTECHSIWKQGDDVHLRESIISHRLPIFSELVVALSGVDDPDRQGQINRLVIHNKGIFVENIERPVKVTHLLCSGDEKTEKMKYAEKFNKSGEAHIKLVWEEWFWDCIHFGGRWPEDKYLVTNPRPEPKPASSPPRSSPQPQDNSSNATLPPSSPPQLTHPHTTDHEEEEIAPVRKRIPHETLKLWENLLGPRGFEVVDGKLKRTPSKSQASQSYKQAPISPTKPKTRLVNAVDNHSILSNFKRTNSFAIKPKGETRRRPFTRVATTGTPVTLLGLQQEAKQPIASGSRLPTDQTHKGGIFSGKKFRALGEAKADNVKSVVEREDGFWIIDDLEDVDFVIVRLVCGSVFYRTEQRETEKSKYRTECWLEKCIFEDRICDTDEHITFRPIAVPTPVPGASGTVISFSGLGESEACWIRRFIRGIGAIHAPNFSKNTTHLLCSSRQGPKAEKALEWGIPIVNMSWIESLLVSTTNSPMTEGGANSPPPLSEDRGGGAVKVDSTHEPVLTSANAANSCETESNPQEVFPPADNSILPNFEFHTNDFLGRSTPKRDRPPKPEPTIGGNAESSSLYLPSAVTRIEEWELVPSSRSPSPMVLMKSPSKEEEREQRAQQVIAESITTLLGKRQASKEEVVTTAQHGRVTKRSRPLSRNKSLNKEKGWAADEVEADSFVFGAPKNGTVFRPVLLESNIEDGDQNVVAEPPEDDGMRVTYEDPRQREERQRLALLLSGKEANIPKPRGKRRSTRLAGF